MSWYIPFKYLRNKFRNYVYNKWQKLEKLGIVEVQIADHCNFSCYSCTHYSQIADKHFYDINVFEKDIKQLSKVMNSAVNQISIMGGEPLLNDRCKDYITIVRKYFPYSGIIVLSNGILLDKQSNDFWENLNKNDVYLNITKYPIKIDIEKIIDLCNKYKVHFDIYDGGSADGYVKESYSCSFDIEGKQDIKDSFEKCKAVCFQLTYGKFYVCPQAAYIKYFNNHFGTNLNITENDYINIYNSSKEEIFKYVKNPIPFCKYCVRPLRKLKIWKSSKKEIEEYLY